MLSRLVVSLDIELREGPLIVASVGGGALALSTGVLPIIAVPTAMAIAVKVRIHFWRRYRPRF